MSNARTNAIPTTYRGVEFRSRLEARYAILWDLLGIQWQYEPLELGDGALGTGYIPDFILQTTVFSSPQVRGPVLVEVRPVIHLEEFAEPITKIVRSGWRGSAIVAGALPFASPTPWGTETPIGRGHAVVSDEHEHSPGDWYPIGWYAQLKQFGMGGDDLSAAWRESGNRSRWMPAR